MAWVIKLMFLLVFSSLFVSSFIVLKPFRKHHRWKLSTQYLKFTYLLYQLILLVYIYLLVFYGKSMKLNSDWVNDASRSAIYLLILVLLMIPHIAILVRRQIDYRGTFNITFGTANIVSSITLILIALESFLE
jgi:hypothetical protein